MVTPLASSDKFPRSAGASSPARTPSPMHRPPRLQVWDVFDVSSKSFTNSLMRTSSYGIFAATTAISLGLATLSLPKPAQKE